MEGSVEFDIWASLVSDSRGPRSGKFCLLRCYWCVRWDVEWQKWYVIASIPQEMCGD